ncbi:hypothetical protein M0804_015429 [Polistes exclamans]|nr:hypothetical protein M0804_015429 [Polistes exclamans]
MHYGVSVFGIGGSTLMIVLGKSHPDLSITNPEAAISINRIPGFNKTESVKWKRLRKKEIFQCKRCQRVGYVSKNCTLQFRCVICDGNHGPINVDNVCPVSKDNTYGKFKCIYCGISDHPVKYGKCPYLVAAHNVKANPK